MARADGTGPGFGTARRLRARRAGAASAAAAALMLALTGPGGLPAVVGPGIGTAAGMSGASRVVPARLADDATGCTVDSGLQAAADQTQTPWEIEQADPQQLGSGPDAATGAGVKVAVIDTGIAGDNPQLGPAVAGGDNLTGGSTSAYTEDVDGHGTMVASIIAARPSSANGMEGVAPGAQLLVYREAGCDISKGGDEKTLAEAVNLAVAAHARVINISQVAYGPEADLETAVKNAYDAGVVVVAAAGNYGSSAPTSGNFGVNPKTYPAAYAPYVLAVGAVDMTSTVASFSETGNYVGVVAPGVGIGALFPDDKIVTDDGTSFSAPYVAGIAALLLQLHPGWTPLQVMRDIEATASGAGTWNSAQGWGVVNAVAALQANPATLPGLYGAGPNAQGPAQKAGAYHGASMAPIVAQPASPVALSQRHDAYLVLIIAGLLVVLAIVGSAVVRDARRRGFGGSRE